VAPRVAADLAVLVDPPIRASAAVDDDDPTAFHLELRHPNFNVVPIFVEASEDREEAALVEAFELVLDSAVFEDTFDPWPGCPRHPHGTHSLVPTLRLGRAMWECPTDQAAVCKIGLLNSRET
jgi:hypothetical protein